MSSINLSKFIYILIKNYVYSIAVTFMKPSLWILNATIAFLSVINVVAWGYAIKEVGDPRPSLDFVFRLVFNRYFMLAMISAFTASVLSYVILRELGVMAGRFFLSLSTLATIIAGVTILGEKYDVKTWVGAFLIFIGSLILGR